MTPGRNHPTNTADIMIMGPSFIKVANMIDARLNVKPHILTDTISLGGSLNREPKSTIHRAAAIIYKNHQASIMIAKRYNSQP